MVSGLDPNPKQEKREKEQKEVQGEKVLFGFAGIRAEEDYNGHEGRQHECQPNAARHRRRVMVSVYPKQKVTVAEIEEKDIQITVGEPYPLPPRFGMRDLVVSRIEALLADSVEAGKFPAAIGTAGHIG